MPVHYHSDKFPPTELDWGRIVPLIGPATLALGDFKGMLDAYRKVLKKTRFKLVYIDGFAGAGSRGIAPSEENLLDFSLEDEDQRYRHGSPLIALGTEPSFDKYVFIEKDTASLEKLRCHIEARPEAKKQNIQYVEGDANERIRDIVTRENWRTHRAVAFLDPFALQVDWSTVEALANTQAVDLWILFPAMAVNRMLPKSGEIPARWKERLNRLFGTEAWQEVFYVKEQADLFGEESSSKTPRVFETLSDYVTAQLASVFAKANHRPLILRNRSGAPLFLLCFASANPGRGSDIAVRIAQHIIDTSHHG